MPKLLVLYASTHGQTEKIATRIGDVLRGEGADVVTEKADGTVATDPSGFDAVVVGASVHAGHHQRDLRDWAKAHAPTLNGMPSAFFSVSLSAAEDADESRRENRKYVDDFAEQTGWTPTETSVIAGALQYLEYDFMTRLLMRLLMKRGHHPTDTSRDYEYTDWDQVEAFARRCSAIAHTTHVGP
ncbi:MAG TPA: flavodoxin domain-containing protein [Thermoleophilaceae bacterium]|nr:flavodoxin domain-containing protein [Thermoleophilaceae bacterium]